MPRLQNVPGGINIITDQLTGKVVEAHSSTCFHCQHVTDFPSRKEMMNYVDFCRGCMKFICLQPVCLARGCRPYEKELERQEELYRLQSRIHMQAWKCY
jgi:hypothetical protein